MFPDKSPRPPWIRIQACVIFWANIDNQATYKDNWYTSEIEVGNSLYILLKVEWDHFEKKEKRIYGK